MIKFDFFVLPFTFGFVYVIAWIAIAMTRIFRSLQASDKKSVKRNLLTYHTLAAVGEILLEVLIHRRIWREKPLLGFMHMSFALGWFMLIATGWVEASITSDGTFQPIWCHIFYKFFHHEVHTSLTLEIIKQLMDFWLLLILSGQAIAVFKRFFHRGVGMKIRTKHSRHNRNAMLALWFIFPLRLLAESCTAALHGGGGFLTGTVGGVLAEIPYIHSAYMPLWWGYSVALGVFFTCIPYSRYLHIPIEGFLILMRHWHVRDVRTLGKVETMACSACGMCLSDCPLARTQVSGIQPVYFIERLRRKRETDDDIWKCLACGRCEQICPVRVQSINLRMAIKGSHSRLDKGGDREKKGFPTGKVVIFSGCMGKMTPRTRTAMEKIMQSAHVDHTFIDDEISLCCGRPLQLNGKMGEAKLKFAELYEAIISQAPKAIVTTCPICYNMLKNKFQGTPVYHHTDFVKVLIDNNLIRVGKLPDTLTYHDPCELSRKADIVRQPVAVLSKIATLRQPDEHGKNTRCCGGALSGIGVNNHERLTLADDAAHYLQQFGAKKIVTACPLCKKTLAHRSVTQVVDYAEIVAAALE